MVLFNLNNIKNEPSRCTLQPRWLGTFQLDTDAEGCVMKSQQCIMPGHIYKELRVMLNTQQEFFGKEQVSGK